MVTTPFRTVPLFRTAPSFLTVLLPLLLIVGAGTSAGGQCTPWQRTVHPTGELGFDLEDVAYGNGVFVAAGRYTKVSRDARTWRSTSGVHGRTTDVAWTGQGFVANAFAGRLAFWSPDGFAWTAMYDVCCKGAMAGNGELVVVAGGSIATSPDGRQWTVHDAPGGPYRDVCWDGTRWIVLTDRGELVTSFDGEVWQMGEPAVPGAVAVAGNGSRLVAVGESSYTSIDDLNWTEILADQPLPLTDIVWTGDAWVAVGSGGRIVSSPDGLSWLQVGRAEGTLRAVTASPETLVAVGARTVAISDDGGAWVEVVPVFPFAQGIVWDGSRFLVAASDAILRTDDGSSWHRMATGLGPGRALDIVHDGSTYVVVGGLHNPDITSSPEFLTSSDGRDWTRSMWWECSSGCCASALEAATWGGAGFLAVSDHGMAVSMDGECWQLAEHPSGARDVLWDGTQYVAVSAEGSFLSSDGLAWSGPFATAVGDPAAIAFSGSCYVVAGRAGVATSNDAMQWTTYDLPTGRPLSGVVWAGDTWVAVDEAGALLSSADGSVWQPEHVPWDGEPPPVLPGFRLAHGGGRTLAVGWGVTMTRECRISAPPRRPGSRHSAP